MRRFLFTMVLTGLVLGLFGGCEDKSSEASEEALEGESPRALEATCRQGLEALEAQTPPPEAIEFLLRACPALLPTDACRETTATLATVPPDARQRVLARGCFMDLCPDAFESLARFEGPIGERPGLLRRDCGPIVGSDLLSDEAFASRFDPAHLEGLDPDTDYAAWAAAMDWFDLSDWLLAEMLYQGAGSLPDTDRAQLRAALSGALLTRRAND